MAILPILSVPDPRLRIKAVPVSEVDRDIRRLMDDMLETIHDGDRGIGLAANQVGVAIRVIVIDLGTDEGTGVLRMANPEFVWKSEEQYTFKEGCLSVPGQWAEVTRPARVHVSYLDENNQSCQLEASDLLAVCVQHEIDHLNGTLFVDHLSALKKKMLVGRAVKEEKARMREKV